MSGDVDGRLRVALVGAGAMGGEWLRMLAASSIAVPVAVVDLDIESARRTCGSAGLDVATGRSLTEVEDAGTEAVINVTVPQAHRIVNEQAMRAGLPVLCEKPLAPTVSEALRQVALANVTGQLLMVSQSRRYFGPLATFATVAREVGPVNTILADFFHEDHEPGFREQMEHPLLVDMSVHHFDMLRYVTDDLPVSVRCDAWNPPWSWFAGKASAVATFELASGARFVYSGSRATPGAETSWNAEWRMHGLGGVATWDGEKSVTLRSERVVAEPMSAGESIEGSLAEFVSCVRSGRTPQNEVRDNVLTLAMIEGATVSSSRQGERVVIRELLDEALIRALRDETREDVAAELQSWPDAVHGLSTTPWGSEPAIASGGAS
ncbi:Gfo/Idh/MocA family protein [Microbacterium sp. NPDC091382]|uniref:Gfo/Idh/MocA family protein n=1 Tax=Microbacterium sp. NPDC091382 TaxID=3364210 RepID=UPI0038289B1F